MKILGIDTSTKICSLGLVEEMDILAEYNLSSYYQKTSSILVFAIKDVLEGVGLKLSDLDGIAVSIGPGSFTGLRIGLGVAKGLSYATSLPLLAIPTLDALAFSLMGMPFLVCPILESKRGEIYSAVFREVDGLDKVVDYNCEGINSLLAKLSFLKEKIIFIGEGIIKYRKTIEEKLGRNALFVGSHLAPPRGVNVAFLGLEKLKKGEEDNIYTLSPLYLRKSQAEIIWEKKYK
ncbi:MAG TPA: tRNA (adenosine(37)-N6)-threonylcarbamoyltransferase complex dimerization subunit type 1 TsaB [Candidatus Atribacteria bacterium]|nr:tRNA (adenosine(37)-N6)-threonylcarbamoyltransferase complex dimerization subunit type 1 TsaB [Candidatus Atribacteria bacterium]